MPPAHPAGQADNHDAEPSGTSRRQHRDRHGRRDEAVPSTRTGPRYTVGPSKTIPMTPDDYDRAVRAWAVLIASWWADNPPEEYPN
jgi:hypothetical protein